MVGESSERPALEETPEVPDGEVEGKELPIECGVLDLGLPQLPAEEGEGLPTVPDPLLEDGAYRYV